MTHDRPSHFPVPKSWQSTALVTETAYRSLYQKSLASPDSFWAEQAQRIDWIKPWSRVSQWSFDKPVNVQWFLDAKLNASVNCVDRHLAQHSERIAYIWEPENPEKASQQITFKQLSERVNQTANALRELGVKKGDRVTLYMPMIPETFYTLLACARIGAVHSVVFAGFSPEALAGRINNCQSDFVVTADHGYRAGQLLPLKENVDLALKNCPQVRHVLVVKRSNQDVSFTDKKDQWYHEVVARQTTHCPPEPMDAEDPLFILYTSGSTGKPKGVLHTTGGYMVYAATTFEAVFNYTPDQTYWCAADVGWITGHSYMIYGPLANAATSVIFEGAPTYPKADRLWQIVDKHQVNILYTAPTLIRALMRDGDQYLNTTSRSSLRLLGSVGEPINPEAWYWYYDKVGRQQCPIVDTWWQTETGGIMITPLPGATDLKPGSASQPFFGCEPVIFNDKGEEVPGAGEGHLFIKQSWPGQMRTVYEDHSRFEDTYFSQKPGYFYTGDECRRDEDGYLWIAGRADDVINVSGHRLGTAEIESALVGHDAVAEAAVVGFKHPIKGQGIYAFVTPYPGLTLDEALKNSLKDTVKAEIGSLAKPDLIQFADALPKTRSGKIMRRILRKIANNEFSDLGDISTLADPQVVNRLVEGRQIFDS
ncbi:MAG: acetate--CoA ligase [Pseudobdellovibrionaceae bacterium]|nr:acetate--CoA ligase [Bdellovibrionales bacterium]USN48003.1 MAG: acetate--CoA ligase [Pseudobdellovibrionaceae bacterium]